MGSNFLRYAVEGPAAFFGRQSTLGKMTANDPAANFLGFENGRSQNTGPMVGGAYAGVAPTLAGANSGYGTGAPAWMPRPAPQQTGPSVGQRAMYSGAGRLNNFGEGY
ncbi:MAG: hypothetical protein KGL39_09760 [Patescibacteria group bacterium]|nr:hypothetical protein [Patescibacteria group bacterium]